MMAELRMTGHRVCYSRDAEFPHSTAGEGIDWPPRVPRGAVRRGGWTRPLPQPSTASCRCTSRLRLNMGGLPLEEPASHSLHSSHSAVSCHMLKRPQYTCLSLHALVFQVQTPHGEDQARHNAAGSASPASGAAAGRTRGPASLHSAAPLEEQLFHARGHTGGGPQCLLKHPAAVSLILDESCWLPGVEAWQASACQTEGPLRPRRCCQPGPLLWPLLYSEVSGRLQHEADVCAHDRNASRDSVAPLVQEAQLCFYQLWRFL